MDLFCQEGQSIHLIELSKKLPSLGEFWHIKEYIEFGDIENLSGIEKYALGARCKRKDMAMSLALTFIANLLKQFPPHEYCIKFLRKDLNLQQDCFSTYYITCCCLFERI